MSADSGTFEHQSDCAVGADIEQAEDFDAIWFELHGLATERRRPLTWGEQVELAAVLGLGDDRFPADDDDQIVTVYRTGVAA